jgi:hypothetical protein
VGLGKVTATLRATLSPQQEETQIVPQVKVRLLHLFVHLKISKISNSVSIRKIAKEKNKYRHFILDCGEEGGSFLQVGLWSDKK